MTPGTTASKRSATLWHRVVNFFSFSRELRRLQRELNTRIDMPEVIGRPPASHERYNKHFQTRRISIAEAYLMVVKDLDSRHFKDRLRALRMLAEASFHSKTVSMPLNTARVQMNLMKEAIKHRHDHRRQLELLHDFAEASYGRRNFIRRLCREHNIIQVPELGKELRDLDSGWDAHVHDTSSTGRKNPTQLVIDAFIKGISRITINYNTTSVAEMMDEALSAGKVLGVSVDVGLEFSVNTVGRRFHFVALLPEIQYSQGARGFLEESRPKLSRFLKGLDKNQKYRLASVKKLVENFNQAYLAEMNEGYYDKIWTVPRLKMSDLEAFMPLENVNRMHLGEFLYTLYRPVLVRRELSARARLYIARNEFAKGNISEWDLQIIARKHADLQSELQGLTPDVLQKRYFTNPALADHETVFDDLEEVAQPLHEAGCRLKAIHPLEHGIESAKTLLEAHADRIDSVEIYNMHDSVNRDPDEILRFAGFVNELNAARAEHGKPIIAPVCGSDAAGRSRNIPGMGFTFESHISGKDRSTYVRNHVVLPSHVCRMIAAGRASRPAEGNGPFDPIVSMGKVVDRVSPGRRALRNPNARSISPARAVRYVNPVLKNLFLVAAGFLLAYWYIGLDYAIIWFAITSIRHFVTDAAARRGLRLREWTTRSVDFGNMSRSLLFTGLSVPILGFVKQGFDLIWPFAHSGILFNFARFFAISLANGLYLVTHNKLRGFEPAIVRANFFRSAISWPFASLFAPIGDLIAVPTIVQAKFWSDFVGGVIEGTGKYLRQLQLRRRDVEEIIPRILERRARNRKTAIIDLLFVFREDPRTRNSLRAIFRQERGGSGNTGLRKSEYDLQTLIELDRLFSDPDLYSTLVRFVVPMRDVEIAGELITLIGGTLPELSEWISEEVKRVGGKESPQEQSDGPLAGSGPDGSTGGDGPENQGSEDGSQKSGASARGPAEHDPATPHSNANGEKAGASESGGDADALLRRRAGRGRKSGGSGDGADDS